MSLSLKPVDLTEGSRHIGQVLYPKGSTDLEVSTQIRYEKSSLIKKLIATDDTHNHGYHTTVSTINRLN